MQIKTSRAPKQTGKVGYLSDGRRVVMAVYAKDLIEKSGLNYYSLKEGTLAYFYDAPKDRIHNCILFIYGKKDEERIILSIPQFICHLIFWKANVLFNIPITDDDIYDLTNPGKNFASDIIEHITQKLIDLKEGATSEVCECIANIKTDLSLFSQNFSTIVCNTISLWNIIKFKNRNNEMNDLLHTVLDKSHTVKELENEMKECERRVSKVISEDKDNCLHPYVKAGRIKTSQLTQVLVAVGTRPDTDKTILPWPVTRGYIHGLQNIAEYFMETITARDALMTKNDNLPRSGYLSREINRLAASKVFINYNVEDCGNERYINYFVKNKDYLSMAKEKYYLDEKTGKLKMLSTKDTHLVGQTIKLRTFITCNCKTGVCLKCVGGKAKRLYGTRLGCLPSIKSINPLSQKALSAKHMLGTKSIAITNEWLLKYFYSDGMDIYIKPDYSMSRNLYIVLQENDIEDLINSSIDTDDDSVDTTFTLSQVSIRDGEEEYSLENDGMRLALSDEILKQKDLFKEDENDENNILIPINKIDAEQPIFNSIIDTEEISKYLSALIGTINRVSIKRFGSIDELMDEMNRIIYDAGFVNSIIHFESIIYAMVRDINDNTLRPNWKDPACQYKICTVSNAIELSDMFTALAYQNLKRIFSTLSIRKRMGTSLYDPYFRITSLEEIPEEKEKPSA